MKKYEEIEDIKRYEEMADKIFEQAGVTKEEFPKEWRDCVVILRAKTAMGYVKMGLTHEAVDIFEKQKQTLVEDLKDIKKQRMN